MTRLPRIPVPDGVAPAAVGEAYQPDVARALAALHAAILRLGALDHETTELVRLRCAQTHDCHG